MSRIRCSLATFTAIGVGVIVVYLLAACRQSEAMGISPSAPVIVPSEVHTQVEEISIPAITDTPPVIPPTARAVPIIDRQLLFHVHSGALLTSRYPFSAPDILLQEEGVRFGPAVWSSDGQALAYTRSSLTEDGGLSESSIWAIQSDGTNTRQLSEILPASDILGMPFGGVSIIPEGWSSTRQRLAVSVYSGYAVTRSPYPLLLPYILSLDSRELTCVYPGEILAELDIDTPEMREGIRWVSFSPNGRWGLFTAHMGSTDLHPSETANAIFVIDLDNPSEIEFLRAPTDFTFNTFFRTNPNIIAWSPDENSFLLTDCGENSTRLWQVTVETNTWEIVSEQPRSAENTVSSHYCLAESYPLAAWSSDGQWVAWWDMTASFHQTSYDIRFLDPTNWTIAEVAHIEMGRPSTPYGFVLAATGDPYFTLWDATPEGGLHLINPETGEDLILVSNDDLRELREIMEGNRMSIGGWQP